MSIIVDFEWFIAAKYKVLLAIPPKPNSKPDMTLLGGDGHSGKPERIIADSDEFRTYRPLEEYKYLYREFAKIEENTRSVNHFVQRFGLLTLKGLEEGEEIPFIIDAAKNMREFINWHNEKNSEAIITSIGSDVGNLPNMETQIVVDPITHTLRLRHVPTSLLGALWLQLAQFLTDTPNIRECRQCGKWFDVGAGTKRRSDAEFCTQAHKIR